MASTDSIASLIVGQGQAEAEGLRERGRIRAEEALRKRAFIGNTLRDIAGLALSIPTMLAERQRLQAQTADVQAQAAQRATDAQVKQRAMQMDQTVNQAMKDSMVERSDGTRVLDRDKLRERFIQGNVPAKIQSDMLKSLDEIDSSLEKFGNARREHAAAVLHGALQHYSPESVMTGIMYGKANGWLTDKDVEPIYSMLASDQDARPVLRQIRDSLTDKYQEKPVKLGPEEQLINPETKEVIATGGPKRMTNEAELAADAANPNSPTATQSAAALEKLKGQKNPPSLEEQLLTALSAGDGMTAARILSTMTATARAKKDPAAEALANELRGLNIQSARERLEQLKEKNKPVDVSQSLTTTASGRQYVNLDEFQTAEAREKAREAATKAGIMVVNKNGAESLRAADTARANLQALYAQIQPYLAKDAAGRVVKGPVNKLEKIFQTNPTLGAFGAWRTAAIQAVQALAERGMGLRLNRAEIELMLENDIPRITDDAPTAKQRIDNMMTLLDNKEKDLLERNRQDSGISEGVKVGGFTVREKK